MASVIGVRLRRGGKVYYFDAAGLELRVKDSLVVETEGGVEVGWVVISPEQVILSEVKGPLKPVLRKATAEDLKKGPSRGAL